MTRRRAWAGTALAVVLVALVVVAAALRHVGDGTVNVVFVVVTVLIGAAFAGVGALLVSERVGHLLGPLLLVSGVALVAQMGLRELAYDAASGVGAVPGWAAWLAWASSWLDVLGLPLPLAVVLLLFPDGRPVGRPWWALVALGVVSGVVRMLLLAAATAPVRLDSHDLTVPWTAWVDLEGRVVDRIDAATAAASALMLLPGAVAILVRHRRGDPETRRSLVPLELSLATLLAGLALQSVPGFHDAGVVVFVVGGASVPVALAVGALRFRLWELDPYVVSAIVYAGLGVLLTVLYVAVVQAVSLLLGRGLESQSLAPSVVATAVVAVVFAPARQRLEGASRRLVFGERATPYETLAALPQRLVDSPATDEILPALAQTLADGLGAATAGVTTSAGHEAWYPTAPGEGAATESVPVVHLGAEVGRLHVVPRIDRPLTRDDRRLLGDLAAQAGSSVRAVVLAEELQDRLADLAASRRRLAVAQSDERRRLQRDLHDGAQQRLVAATVQLGVSRSLLHRDPDAALERLAEVDAELRAGLDEIRELARGLHPSMLEASGLEGAVRARAEVARQPVDVTATGLDGVRLPSAVEAAAYFCCLEALQNAAKHAPGATVRIDLELDGDELRWSVADDGPGFDGRLAVDGGLAGLEERLAALGGRLDVRSSSTGTTVAGVLPVAS